jgi:hypothetical protein
MPKTVRDLMTRNPTVLQLTSEEAVRRIPLMNRKAVGILSLGISPSRRIGTTGWAISAQPTHNRIERCT